MSLQVLLDNQALDMFPKIKRQINKQTGQMRETFIEIALNEINNSFKPISKMTPKSLDKFENYVLHRFADQLRIQEDWQHIDS